MTRVPVPLVPQNLRRPMRFVGADKAHREAPLGPARDEDSSAVPLSLSDMGPEFRLIQKLERELEETQTALERARSELARARIGEQQALFQANHDSLTALPNQAFFRDRLAEALIEGRETHRSATVLFVDLDGFKLLNDAHGHRFGDDLLRIVAARMAHAVRGKDLVSRLGGDEFGCLLSGMPDRRTVGHLAGKLFDAVSAPMQIRDINCAIMPSIGISVSPGDGTTADALLQSADIAMYQAKRERTRFAFYVDRLAIQAPPAAK